MVLKTDKTVVATELLAWYYKKLEDTIAGHIDIL